MSEITEGRTLKEIVMGKTVKIVMGKTVKIVMEKTVKIVK